MRNKVGIVGSRNIPVESHYLIRDYILQLPKETIIISGGARGVDSLAVKYARECDLQTIEFLPDIKRHGIPRAFFERNTIIVNKSDYITAFWDGKSTGTLDSIRKAINSEKSVLWINFNGSMRTLTSVKSLRG